MGSTMTDDHNHDARQRLKTLLMRDKDYISASRVEIREQLVQRGDEDLLAEFDLLFGWKIP